MSKKSKRKFEYEIDSLTIVHGAGWQLYEWSYFVLNLSKASEDYKNFKREIYMKPEEIETLILKIGI